MKLKRALNSSQKNHSAVVMKIRMPANTVIKPASSHLPARLCRNRSGMTAPNSNHGSAANTAAAVSNHAPMAMTPASEKSQVTSWRAVAHNATRDSREVAKNNEKPTMARRAGAERKNWRIG